MSALDAKMRALATNLIAKFGKSITLTTVTAGTYDTATRLSTPTTSGATVNATIETYKAGEVRASGGLVLMNDKKITIASADVAVTPSAGDTVTIDSVVWTVQAVSETWSGAQTAIFILQVRK